MLELVKKRKMPEITNLIESCDISTQSLIELISCNFFSESQFLKNSDVKRVWSVEIWRWVTAREVLFKCARVMTKSVEKTDVDL